MTKQAEVVIIGAGPSGSIAAALLKKMGHQVVVLEKDHFPRFSIGESLLPQCMEFIELAGMTEAVCAEKFQLKNGAAFACDDKHGSFDFTAKSTLGPSTTFQVLRSRFDQVLANTAVEQGVDIRFGKKVTGVSFDSNGSSKLTIENESGKSSTLTANYLLDASGFGRVLPRLLDLELPSELPIRQSVFTHIEDNICGDHFDRNKILIVIHPQYHDVWYWLIPFSNGRCSLGVVSDASFFDRYAGKSNIEIIREVVADSPNLSPLLSNSRFDTPVQMIKGYSSNVKSLWGKGFALLGNAGEFLDPVFSSGVTIAMKSATLVAPLVSRQLKGGQVEWEAEYSQLLQKGVETFRAYVNNWYDGSLKQIIFADNHSPATREMVCSIFAGYAWDTQNPFVQEPEKRLKTLAQLCATV
ncbi:MAG: NAD(P)/FAD-dependent oxidoreductase [Nitrosomonadales bacterium]|nr:MAG: NAD(P)/FAD-dependent oxidoreductase [Nitrosomonadales bacterium]